MHPDPAPTSGRLRRVVVLAGGGSRRLGSDKLVADLDGRGVLEALLDAVRAAGLAAGTGSDDDDLVAVLAGDQPFGAAALAVLTAACSGDRSLDGAVGVD